MTVTITGTDLTVDEVVRVARDGEGVAIAPTAIERMRHTRAVVERALDRGDEVYGLSTGVGVLKRVELPHDPEGLRRHNAQMIAMHRVAQGPAAPSDIVRATMLRLANHLALGTPGVRPELAEHVVGALNDGAVPVIRMLGSVGQSDLASMADLAHALLADGFELAPGEGLALLNNNAFATGWGALAIADAGTLLDAMEAAGALSLEGFGANLSTLHPAVAASRPYPGLREALANLRSLLAGSRLWDPGAARNLQDPLTFRNLPQIQGAARDGFASASAALRVELNASQGNPLVVADEDRVISVANFEVAPFAIALDLLRIALAPAVTSAGERIVKLLETPWSGLPTGLTVQQGTADAGLGYLGIASQALVAEARILAQPVSFEMASSSHAEGIEDRTTMAPLAARRLADQVEIAARVVANELVVAAQAVELRHPKATGIGTGVAAAMEAVRGVVPFMSRGDLVPQAAEPVFDLVRSGALGRSVRDAMGPQAGT